MGKKQKLRKQLAKRELDEGPAVVICVGKHCAPRAESRALADDARAYAAETSAPVRIAVLGCLHICKKGPIVATVPQIKFHKRVDAEEVHHLIDELARDT